MKKSGICISAVPGLFLTIIVACSLSKPLTVEEISPEGFNPSFRTAIEAQLIVAGGQQNCGDLPGVNPETYAEAVKASAKSIHFVDGGNPAYTLLAKNVDCCVGGPWPMSECTGTSYWALRDNQTEHVLWQVNVNEKGVGTPHLDGGKRIREAIFNHKKQCIVSALTQLSQADIQASEKAIEDASSHWREHRDFESFLFLYNYLLLSAQQKKEQTIGKFKSTLRGDLMAAFNQRYVSRLMGRPDNTIAGQGDNISWEWQFNRNGKESIYRLSFFQRALSGSVERIE